VHDPVAAGAFHVFDNTASNVTLRERLLFQSVPDRIKYGSQYEEFVWTLRDHGSKVLYVSEILEGDAAFLLTRDNPNQVYTRDALITVPWIKGAYISGRMKSPIRGSERRVMERVAQRLGLVSLCTLPDNLILEGGDVIPFVRNGVRCLLMGFGPRTQLATIQFLANELIPDHVDEIVGIELAAWRINLDGGMMPIGDDVMVAHPGSLLSGFRLTASTQEPIDVLDMFRDLGMRIIEATLDESVALEACNCLCLGDGKVICYDLSERIVQLMRRHDIDVIPISGSELVKGTGGPRCMSRPIY
jgi:N-dimethylarginine dimethylaminohydrolase